MKNFIKFLLTVSTLLLAPSLSSGGIFNKENAIGAAIGGLAGGVIGHQSGHKTEGAILGSVAGYAIGSVVQDEKQKKRSYERPQTVIVIEETAVAATPAQESEPRFTKSEERQLLLQSAPLFSVKRSE